MRFGLEIAMQRTHIVCGDRLQCEGCEKLLDVTSVWIDQVRDRCYKSKKLLCFVAATCPINALPVEILSIVRCRQCGSKGAQLLTREINEPSIDIYCLSDNGFSILADQNFQDLSSSQIITIYNQREGLSMSREHRRLLEKKYSKAYEILTRRVTYGFVEYSATDGQD